MRKFIAIMVVLAACVACLPIESVDQDNAVEDLSKPYSLWAYYNFDGNTDDASGWYRDANPIGDPSFVNDTPSSDGKAIMLNGFKEQYLTIPYALPSAQQEYSVAFWIKDFTNGVVFCSTSSDYVRSYYPRLVITDDQLFRFYTAYDNYDHTEPFNFSCASMMSSQWCHVAVTCKKSQNDNSKVIRTLYVNGKAVDSQEYYWSEGNSPSMQIGGNCNGEYSKTFSGKLDNFRIYTVCLETKNVAYLYNNGL